MSGGNILAEIVEYPAHCSVTLGGVVIYRALPGAGPVHRSTLRGAAMRAAAMRGATHVRVALLDGSEFVTEIHRVTE